MAAPLPPSSPPGFELNQLKALMRSLEDTCLRIDDQLKKLGGISVGEAKEATSLENPDKPWSLFEAAPEVASGKTPGINHNFKKIPAQPIPELPSELEQSTLDHLNQALSAAFRQVLQSAKGTGSSRPRNFEEE